MQPKFNKFCLLAGIILLSVLAGCSDDGPKDDPKDQAPELIQKVNRFVYENFQDAYLWSANVPDNIDIRYIFKPKDMLDSVLYKPDDRFSLITDDAESLANSFAGVETTFGYSLARGKFTNTGNYFAIIQFIYPNTPAEKAGLKRGDIFLTINGGDITPANVNLLYDASTIQLGLGFEEDGHIKDLGKTVSMAAVKMQLDPVVSDKIIDKSGKRIGYLCYTDYNAESQEKLVEVLTGFKGANVTDVVLDLRYNGGGLAETARFLSSMLAPASVTSAKKIYLKEIWNAEYNAYWQSQGQDLDTRFDNTVPVNLDLDHLYVLTGKGTASASEATIVGLSPYLTLTRIGETTYGKYCGGVLLRPQKWTGNEWVNIEEIYNWGIYIMVYRFANSNGETDFKNGFTPHYTVKDDLYNTFPLGDEQDPLLAKAMELITGSAPVAAKPATRSASLPELRPIYKNPFHGIMLDNRQLRPLK